MIHCPPGITVLQFTLDVLIKEESEESIGPMLISLRVKPPVFVITRLPNGLSDKRNESVQRAY